MSKTGEFYRGMIPETYYSREEILERLSDDYIRGLIEGEGYFGPDTRQDGKKVPEFVLKMHVRDKELLEAIRDYLEIPNRVYEYIHQDRHYAMLIVREIGALKNKMLPLCNRKLLGHKGTQFDWWLQKFPYLGGRERDRTSGLSDVNRTL